VPNFNAALVPSSVLKARGGPRAGASTPNWVSLAMVGALISGIGFAAPEAPTADAATAKVLIPA
jgi:hypothetical protein